MRLEDLPLKARAQVEAELSVVWEMKRSLERRVAELEAMFGEVFNDHNEPDGAPDGGYEACDCRFCAAWEKLLRTRN